MCEEKEIIMVMMSVLEPTTSAAETRGFLHANTSAKAVTAQVPTSWDHSRIILQQMFSFTVFPHLVLLFSSRTEMNNMAATCSGHERKPRFGN